MILHQLCTARGLTLEQLAERAGVPPAVVAKLEAGTLRPQPITLRRLAAVLGLEPEALRDAFTAARQRQAEWRRRQRAARAAEAAERETREGDDPGAAR